MSDEDKIAAFASVITALDRVELDELTHRCPWCGEQAKIVHVLGDLEPVHAAGCVWALAHLAVEALDPRNGSARG